jgi:hypothetical protein
MSQETQSFEFYVDRKVTIWAREKHSVEAASYEDAKRMMIESFDNRTFDSTFYENEYLYETEQDMTPQQNENRATLELYSDLEHGELISNNIKQITH